MAKHKRLISIVTSVLMLVTMTGVTAYATEQNADLDVQDNPAAVEDQVAPENAEVTDEALPEDEVVLNEGEETIAPTMTIDPIDPQTYTGKELKPSPVVKVGETVLSEAKKLGYGQAELEVVTENLGAIALYEAVGFVKCGVLPNSMKYRDGTTVDSYWMVKIL